MRRSHQTLKITPAMPAIIQKITTTTTQTELMWMFMWRSPPFLAVTAGIMYNL